MEGRTAPDAKALARLLEARGDDLAGLILRLVWRAGLNREEIAALTWARVDLDEPMLRLPDREIPLEAETAEFLRRWKAREAGRDELVARSRRRRRLSPSAISVAARRALEEAGLGGVGFRDLRRDYVRRQFSERPWPEALRVTGLSLSAYRNALAGELGPGPEPEAAEPDGEEADYRLWRVLQAERDKPAGVALWLTNQLGLGLGEIAALTWDRVDLASNALRLPDREVALTLGVRRVLQEAEARRKPGEDPHVLLTPRTRRPMDASRLGALLRQTLIRGGITDRTAGDLRARAPGAEERRLLALVRAAGSVSRAEAAAALGIGMGAAYTRLRRLADAGWLELRRPEYRYYITARGAEQLPE